MKMTAHPVLILCLTIAALALLGTVFFALPIGWNVLPLILIALVIVLASDRLRVIGSGNSIKPEKSCREAPFAENAGNVESRRGKTNHLARRLNGAFGPIAAGMIIDLIDLSTFGPIGVVLGLPIGGLAGYWLGNALGLSRKVSLWCALAAGVYCMIPFTEVIPLATIVGAYVRFQRSETRQRTEENNQ